MILSPVPSHNIMKKLCEMRRREVEPQFQPGVAPLSLPSMFHSHVQQLLPPLLKTKTLKIIQIRKFDIKIGTSAEMGSNPAIILLGQWNEKIK